MTTDGSYLRSMAHAALVEATDPIEIPECPRCETSEHVEVVPWGPEYEAHCTGCYEGGLPIGTGVTAEAALRDWAEQVREAEAA